MAAKPSVASKYARHDLKLPQEIPKSMIAEKLNKELNNLISDVNNTNKNINNKVDAISILICEKIIIAFHSMYNKYIDPNNAIFMINISSRNRDILNNLFAENNYNNDRSRSRSYSIDLIKRRFFHAKQAQQNSKMLTITHEINYFITENINCLESILFKWILSKMIFAMERSVREISGLMNDSFKRFKRKHRQQFYDLCKKIDQRSSL